MSTPDEKKSRATRASEASKEMLAESVGQAKALGEIITWAMNSNRGIKNKQSEVVAALKAAGLEEKYARDFSKTQAFARACNILEKEERIIDVIRDDKDHILFQFSKAHALDDKEEGGKQLEYGKEAKILLNKTTGDIQCKDAAITEKAKYWLDKCLEDRTTSDVSNIATQLFRDQADLIDISAGTYFVPQEHLPFAGKVEAFLKALGRKMYRLPLPAGTASGDASVQDAMAAHFGSLVEDLNESVEGFSLTTRDTTIESTVGKINATKAKIEAYALYLQDKKDELLKAVEEANSKLVAKVEGITEERKQLPPEERGGIQGRVLAVLNGEPKAMKEIEVEAQLSQSCYNLLNRLAKEGRVVKVGSKYKLPA